MPSPTSSRFPGAPRFEGLSFSADVPGDDTLTSLPWSHTRFSTLLDLTDPLLPTVIADGIYALLFSVDVPAAAAGRFEIDVDLDYFGLDQSPGSGHVPFKVADIQSISFYPVYHFAAGMALHVTVFQNSTVTKTFTGACTCQLLG